MQALTIGVMNAKSIDELMAYEGNIREIYYKAWNNFLPQEFSFDKRTRMPPKSMINAMISFGNSLTYSVCLSEIYRTPLSPVISFLHEPSERRFSLSLDLAEIFKPILTDKTIFYLINKKIIDHNYFSVEAGFYFLNERGRKLFIEEFEKRLNQTIETPSGNKISIQKAIKVEAYKIIKHLLGIKEYQPLVIS
jgi:CRISPR-associated protein Cas1